MGVGPGPGFPEKVETGSLALGAGSMSGRQSRGFVKEEQLGADSQIYLKGRGAERADARRGQLKQGRLEGPSN